MTLLPFGTSNETRVNKYHFYYYFSFSFIHRNNNDRKFFSNGKKDSLSDIITLQERERERVCCGGSLDRRRLPVATNPGMHRLSRAHTHSDRVRRVAIERRLSYTHTEGQKTKAKEGGGSNPLSLGSWSY